MHKLVLLLLTPLLSGCWQSEADLYAGQMPVTPFKPGPIEIANADNSDVSHQKLALDGAAYRISGKNQPVMVVRFHPLPGAVGYLVADVTGWGSCPTGACEQGTHSYALAHLLPNGRVEEIAQNCDDGRAEKVGAVQKGFVCEFSDRATLEKALRSLLAEKPTAVIRPE